MANDEPGYAASDDFLLTTDEQEDLDEAEAEIDEVSYSGTDFDVEGLVRRLDRKEIVVPNFGHGDESLELAGFQRGFVWRRPQMDRFIESLLLGFPIPGIMLVQQADKRYLVLDGQQRMKTMQAFYRGVHLGREFSLENVAEEFKGLTYGTLSAEQQRQVDNTFIQATIVKTDGSSKSLEAIYQVFERLNSGGTQLTPHEIRIALYPGEFVDFLARLNTDRSWRALYGVQSPRLRDQELILRIIALTVDPSAYTRPLKKFLNDFLGKYRDLKGLDANRIENLFKEASAQLLEDAGATALRFQSNRINAAFSEAVFVGLMRRLTRNGPIKKNIGEKVRQLAANRDMAGAVSGSTAAEENLQTRIKLAINAFARV